MFDALPTYLSLLIAFMLGYMIIRLYNFERSLPNFQQVFDEFGEGLGKTFTEGLQNPTVKRAMSVLGKQSGDVRASKALKNRVADKALGQSVIIKKALDYFGLSALEGVELMQDPTFGPIIQGFITKGGQGPLGSLSSNNSGGRSPFSNRQVRNMS